MINRHIFNDFFYGTGKINETDCIQGLFNDVWRIFINFYKYV